MLLLTMPFSCSQNISIPYRELERWDNMGIWCLGRISTGYPLYPVYPLDENAFSYPRVVIWRHRLASTSILLRVVNKARPVILNRGPHGPQGGIYKSWGGEYRAFGELGRNGPHRGESTNSH